MYKKYLLIACFCLIYCISQSQSHKQTIGISAGINYSNIISKGSKYEIFDNSNYIFGLTTSIIYDYQLNNILIIGTGLGFTQKGYCQEIVFANEYAQTIGKSKIYYLYDYIFVPLKLQVQKGDKFIYYGFIGVSPSYLVKSTFYVPAYKGLISESTENMTPHVSKFDFVGNVGIGFSNLFFNKCRIGVNFGYDYSFITFTNKNYFDDFNMKHYGFNAQISLKYLLN